MDNQQRSFLILNNTEKKNNERRKDGIKNITESETIDLINKKHFNEYVFEEFLGEFESYSKTKFKVTHIPCKRSLTFQQLTLFSNSSKIFTKESLEKTIWFDRIKNEYCETNKINLLRIDYREDILEVLRRTFNDYRKQ